MHLFNVPHMFQCDVTYFWFLFVSFDALHHSQQILSQRVGTLPLVESLLNTEEKGVCSRTQHSDSREA